MSTVYMSLYYHDGERHLDAGSTPALTPRFIV